MQFTIEKARQYGGFTQTEIAKKLNISTKTYQSYEYGKVSMRMDKALKFSELTKIPLKQIIF
ncbi:hypothetical protein FC35_GL001243 [Limosilactobacillus coleohominis DSM 14060]|nr:hypothetical protein FC35_GL001243 [Limosilactobacillus coleohominis DSM 14060]